MRRDKDLALTRWLRAHDGVISARQAELLGISGATLGRLVSSGRLVRMLYGVYVDGSKAIGPRTALAAAMVAAGRGAVVSHQSAAWLWGLQDRPPARPTLTVPRDRRFRSPAVEAHHAARATTGVRRGGFLVTDPCETLVDLAVDTAPESLDDLVDRALSRAVVTLARLALATRPDPLERRAGAALLRRRLELRYPGDAPAPSVLESRMGRLLRRLEADEAIPVPQAEVVWTEGRYRLDFAWPALRLGVEVDGYVWHATSAQMGRDLHRRNLLATGGWAFLVYTWAQVVREPQAVMAEIADTYRRRKAAAS